RPRRRNDSSRPTDRFATLRRSVIATLLRSVAERSSLIDDDDLVTVAELEQLEDGVLNLVLRPAAVTLLLLDQLLLQRLREVGDDLRRRPVQPQRLGQRAER